MTQDTGEREAALREALADLEHRQWAHWTRYMLDNMMPENIARWRSQIETPYVDLTEAEKDSDRVWADKVLALIDTPAPPAGEREAALREAVAKILPLKEGVLTDVKSAHSGRGNGASEWMREDDRDFRSDLRNAFAAIESALIDTPTPPATTGED